MSRVMTLWETYTLAHDLEEALVALEASPGPVRLIAGGTDLLLDLQQGRCPPVRTLVDISEAAELRLLEIRGDQLFVGAAVPLSSLLVSPLVVWHALALQEACALVAGPQVRNMATLGGNVAHALPAGDGSIALLALGARAEVTSRQGTRVVSLPDLFAGPGQSTLAPGKEILVGFYLPLRKAGDSSAFRRIMRPQGVALPILNMAVSLHRQEDRPSNIRIAVGPAGKVPYRAIEVESLLSGKAPDEHLLEKAIGVLLEKARFRTSPYRAHSAYRYHLASILFNETLFAAWEGAAHGIHA